MAMNVQNSGALWERGEMQKTDADADDAMNPSFAALCTAVFPRPRESCKCRRDPHSAVQHTAMAMFTPHVFLHVPLPRPLPAQ